MGNSTFKRYHFSGGLPNPQALAAGMVEIPKGRIYRVDNSSGHFKPGGESMSVIQEQFLRIPDLYFYKNFQGFKTDGE